MIGGPALVAGFPARSLPDRREQASQSLKCLASDSESQNLQRSRVNWRIKAVGIYGGSWWEMSS